MNERKEKAFQLSKKMEEAKAALLKLDEAKNYINSVISVGSSVSHKKYVHIAERNSRECGAERSRSGVSGLFF